MQVAINLTPVLVTLIICVFLYAMCKMARKDAKEDTREIEVTGIMNNRIRVVGNNREKGIREYVEDQVKNGEGKQ